jgi:heat shock protein HslJ
MKFVLGIITCLIISGFTLKPTDEAIVGKWKLDCFVDRVLDKEDCRPDELYSKNMLSIYIDENGAVSGLTTSNSFGGKYTIDNAGVTFFDLMSTEVMERGWGSDFLDHLSKVNSFKIKENRLILFYDSDLKAMTFVPFIE